MKTLPKFPPIPTASQRKIATAEVRAIELRNAVAAVRPFGRRANPVREPAFDRSNRKKG